MFRKSRNTRWSIVSLNFALEETSKITDHSSLSCVVVNCTNLMQTLFSCGNLAKEFTGFVHIFSFCVCMCVFSLTALECYQR